MKTKPYQLTYRIRGKVLYPLSSVTAYYKFQLNNKRKGHAIMKGNCELLIDLGSLKSPEEDLGSIRSIRVCVAM